MAGAAVLACAGTANATVYDLNVYDAASGIQGASLGTVTVTGEGTTKLDFNVVLNANVSFQLLGTSDSLADAHDVFWFDLTPFTGAINSDISTPNADGLPPGGDYPIGGQFVVVRDLDNVGGQGWTNTYDYGVRVYDSVGQNEFWPGPLVFSVEAADKVSPLNLFGSTSNSTPGGATVYGGADLRQCLGTEPCKTGPVGFTRIPDQTSVTPEPSTWATMLLGFGFIGGAMRRRKPHQSVRVAYA
jgi:hypothetical protein